MAYTERLAVGLAVGVPSFLILTFVLILWLRNQRKQRREDQRENEYDLGIRDDELFGRFQEELHRPYQKEEPQPDPNKSSSTAQGTESAEKPYISSNGSSTSTTTIEHHNQSLINPPKSSHTRSPTKSGSAYDFYDSFIPVLHPGSTNQNSSSTLQELAPPVHDAESTNASSNNVSILGSALPREKSLDNLAKQLTAPAFFEKLPSRAATVSLKHRGPGSQVMTANNSSSDLVGLTINEHNTINDNFVYEAPKVDTKADNAAKANSSTPGALSKVLGGQIDNSFDKDAGMTNNSPFKDSHTSDISEESEPGVVFQ
ncbi:uncharacterized protein CANTADRAFT_90120 [Suhomyces tanzawaensis NRRL Y-17324]|uniref:Uncharacterized protein n=1 Tax=Suhomyces tanzawaensis NRRL Y-17324 TaxID=984487 RepID=A0A1E4SHR1_9ASCO|nr:uncharacterized protein CANTADRAFT_90120 [Suhomyces tanzawaensis NRRL Y-17324]ODV79010.1 hypothetical protein CANTADRAFT_90120 [Suhomyces tanzawaensis NRRL Y-17324]